MWSTIAPWSTWLIPGLPLQKEEKCWLFRIHGVCAHSGRNEWGCRWSGVGTGDFVYVVYSIRSWGGLWWASLWDQEPVLHIHGLSKSLWVSDVGRAVLTLTLKFPICGAPGAAGRGNSNTCRGIPSGGSKFFLYFPLEKKLTLNSTDFLAFQDSILYFFFVMSCVYILFPQIEESSFFGKNCDLHFSVSPT
jgi:hypothetical protein